MKKLIALILTSSMLLLTACDNTRNDSPSGTGSGTNAPDKTEAEGSGPAQSGDASTSEEKELPPEETQAPPPSGLGEDEQRQYMIDNSLMTLGDTSRMIRVLKKAAAGEEITVGYIGGSITEGLTAGAEKCWAKLTYDALCEMFPETKINYVNAGLSGTPSVLGVVRAERDLFKDKTPDIVFIEFAVNDGGDQIYKDCYESLVRKSLDKDNDPAVVLLFTVLKNRYSCQSHMSAVGRHYDLPMISVGNAINPMFDAEYMTWEKYSDDESHPNIWGHELVKDFIMNYFEQVKKLADETDAAPELTPLPDSAFYTAEYAGMEFIGKDALKVQNVEGFKENDNVIANFDGWMYRGKTGASITFTAEFKTLFLVFRCSNSDSYADAEVIIDGESVNTVPSNKPGGWGNPEADPAWSGEGGEHTVEIKVGSSDKALLYGFLGVGVVK